MNFEKYAYVCTYLIHICTHTSLMKSWLLDVYTFTSYTLVMASTMPESEGEPLSDLEEEVLRLHLHPTKIFLNEIDNKIKEAI